jgi:hypothetical protein
VSEQFRVLHNEELRSYTEFGGGGGTSTWKCKKEMKRKNGS